MVAQIRDICVKCVGLASSWLSRKKDIGTGFLVTELIGSSINMVTGDYSRGASGYWIENGEITYPVSGVTVAGNLRTMFAGLEPANDLIFRSSTVAPSCFLGEMTLAGR